MISTVHHRADRNGTEVRYRQSPLVIIPALPSYVPRGSGCSPSQPISRGIRVAPPPREPEVPDDP